MLSTVDALGLGGNTRMIYTSDHGELFGAHGLFGKRVLYEPSAGVPLIVTGPGVPRGERRAAPVSHVDLFPSVLEAVGVPALPEDADLPGRSLWGPAAGQESVDRPVFAEYHAHGSAAGMFMLRRGVHKLIHHAGMAPELFDLAQDATELHDLADEDASAAIATDLLRDLALECDPGEADALAKADQRKRVEELGGRDVVAAAERILYSPAPGVELERTSNGH